MSILCLSWLWMSWCMGWEGSNEMMLTLLFVYEIYNYIKTKSNCSGPYQSLDMHYNQFVFTRFFAFHGGISARSFDASEMSFCRRPNVITTFSCAVYSSIFATTVEGSCTQELLNCINRNYFSHTWNTSDYCYLKYTICVLSRGKKHTWRLNLCNSRGVHKQLPLRLH